MGGEPSSLWPSHPIPPPYPYPSLALERNSGGELAGAEVAAMRREGRGWSPPSQFTATRRFGRFPRCSLAFASSPIHFPFLLRAAPERPLRSESAPRSRLGLPNWWGGAREGAEVGRSVSERLGPETEFSLWSPLRPRAEVLLSLGEKHSASHVGGKHVASRAKCAFSFRVDLPVEKMQRRPRLRSKNWALWGRVVGKRKKEKKCWFFLTPFHPGGGGRAGGRNPVLCRIHDKLEQMQALKVFLFSPLRAPHFLLLAFGSFGWKVYKTL